MGNQLKQYQIERLSTNKNKKKRKLRNNEYYFIQDKFDELYAKSINGGKFTNLMEIITTEENILLAYRNMKTNAGSKTPGMDRKDIEFLASKSSDELIKYVRNRLNNYKPQNVKRVNIPKGNGKTRPLGISTIGDRLVQQCILQVLEPICEAKFYKHSYGFRPNRSTHHAISRCYSLMNRNKLHYVVDIDIKGFFDNIDHGKLLKQIWTIGIKDKRLIKIISKMLKAPVNGVIQEKGTPQGGILSPLLSNIVLNELDWWIASQWETFPTRTKYKSGKYNKEGNLVQDNSIKYKTLRRSSNLKEVFIVRYADDFKLFCRDYKTAVIMYNSVTKWLKDRLKLEISQEKSKITNVRKNYTNFLGIKMKVVNKGEKKVVKSHITEKAKKQVINRFKNILERIKKQPIISNVAIYNSAVLGCQQYYRVATMVNYDFSEIDYLVSRYRKRIVQKYGSKNGTITELYKREYGECTRKIEYIAGHGLFPISYVQTKPPRNFSQDVCDYTVQGRKSIHNKIYSLDIDYDIMYYLLRNPILNQSVEYNDNRISLYIGQNGKCGISGEYLEIGDMEVHHITPKSLGGNDKYSNLIYLRKIIHHLIHYKDKDKIRKVIDEMKPNEQIIEKINKFRALAGNYMIQL